MTGKPRRKAVALSYDPQTDTAPQLIAKGYGHIARRIIELAREHGVFVHQDPALVEMLMGIELAENIPPQLYQVVSEVLGMVYRANTDLARKRGLRQPDHR